MKNRDHTATNLREKLAIIKKVESGVSKSAVSRVRDRELYWIRYS
jgi:hypothetical protein